MPRGTHAEAQDAVPFGRILADLLIALAVLGALAAPLLAFSTQGYDLVGMAEESVGYRFFYSLRLMEGDTGQPWLPQGQFVGVIHQAILGIIGLSEPLDRSVAAFTFYGTLLPLLVTGLSIVVATTALARTVEKITLALLVVLAAYQARVGGGYHLLLPDYYSWAAPLALITLGWALRTLRVQTGLGVREAVCLGLFAGVCVTVKPTYVVLPVILGALHLLRGRRVADLFDFAVVTLLTGLVTTFAISLVYYHGNYALAAKHFLPEKFSDLRDGSIFDIAEWFEVALLGTLDLVTLAMIAPLALLASIAFLPRRQYAAALLPSAVMGLLVAALRFYPPTLIETSVFGIVIFFIWWHAVCVPLRSLEGERYPWLLKGRWRNRAAQGIVAILVLLVVARLYDFHRIFTPSYQMATAASEALHSLIKQSGGRTLIVIPSNDLRLLTIETAIYKGALDLNERTWASNSLVASRVPNYHFLAIGDARVDPLDFNTLAFVTIEGRERAIQENLEKILGLPLDTFECGLSKPLGRASFNFFLPSIESKIPVQSTYAPTAPDRGRNLVACVRKPIPLQMPRSEELIGAHLREHRLFVHGKDGPIELAGSDNSSLFLPGYGGWDAQSKRVTGASVRWTDGRWTMNIERLPHYNVRLLPRPRVDFWVNGQKSAPEVVTISNDGPDKYLRVRPWAPGANARLYAKKFPVNGPVAVRFTVRVAKGVRPPTAVLTLIGPDGHRTLQECIVEADGKWRTVTLQGFVSNIRPGDHFSIGHTRASGDDSFEVKSIEVFNAVLPN